MESNGIPKWLNKDFFLDVLEKEYGEYEILNFSGQQALEKGENFASTLYSAAINIKTKDEKKEEVSYMVKALPDGDLIKEIIKNVDFFPKEIKMYCDVIPQFEQMYRDLGEKVKFSPKCFKSSENPECFVMEDLNRLNFSTSKCRRGLNLGQVRKVLEKLGKFHAASAVFHDKNGEYSSDLVDGLYTEQQRPKFQTMYRNNFVIFKKCLLDYGLDKRHLNKLDTLSDSFYNKLLETLAIKPDEFNVLNHGDLWRNNIMFHYDDSNDVDEVYFVDYQVCKWGSPIQDLYSFIISSTESDIRIKHFDYMIKYYHDHLVINLKRLQYSKRIPNLVDLHIDLLKKGFYAVLVSMGITALAHLSDEDKTNIDNLIRQQEDNMKVKEQLYSNPQYVKTIKQLFPFFENRGLFDT